MKNLYQIRNRVVISAINGALPTDSYVSLPASCLLFGVGGGLTITIKKDKPIPGNYFFVGADINFKATSIDCKGFVIIFFDAVSAEHYFLSTKHAGCKVIKLEWKTASEKLLKEAFVKMNETESDAFLDKLFKEFFDTERKSISHEYDSRTVLIDEYIRKNIREKISNKDLAAKIFLSESRFYHFFKEQTNVNVSRYVLWLRLKTIFEHYFKSESKLNALLDITNFTDLSHLIKAFKSFFGESPKRLLNKK